MKLCGACKGKGVINFNVCEVCGGEGIDVNSTFTIGKIQRRRSSEQEIEPKRIKFDKKNASRSV